MDNTETKLEKHIVTQEDLDANPSLIDEGVKIGDEIELPAVTKDELAIGIEAGKVHDLAIAEGKTPEEAAAIAKAFYEKAMEPVKQDEVVATPSEAQNDVVAEKLEKPIPDVIGRFHEGKELRSAHWAGDRLQLKSVEGVTYLLSGAELDAFLASLG